MDSSTALKLFSEIRFFSNSNGRAPHKPLLLLWYLKQLREHRAVVSYKQVADELTPMLLEFGKSQKKNAYEPFWRLQNDANGRLWNVEGTGEIKVVKGGVSVPSLLANDARGAMPEDLRELLLNDKATFNQVVNYILESSFPHSLHEDILDRVGLCNTLLGSHAPRARDPKFRKDVLEAYQYRCAICDAGYQLNGTSHPITEAAHIRWHAANGPDEIANGLALCNFHHKLFDRGAIGVSNDLTTIVSAKLTGTNDAMFARWILDFEGKPIRLPREDKNLPKQKFIEWHRKEVFLD